MQFNAKATASPSLLRLGLYFCPEIPSGKSIFDFRQKISPDKSILELLGEVVHEAVDGQAHLSHRVALTHRYATVFEGVEIDGDAVGRADFVLTTISLADGCGRVEVASEVL